MRWEGQEDGAARVAPDKLWPGDVVVLPVTAGGYDAFGWAPHSAALVPDIADEAYFERTKRRIERRDDPEAECRGDRVRRWSRGVVMNSHRRAAPLEAKIAQEGLVLTESQLAALEKAKNEKEAHGEFESECPGYCGAQDTFYVGTMKGVGRIYQQTFIDTYAKIAFAKLYDRKTPLTAADLLNDRVVPFYDQHEVRLCRVLTDRGAEYCGNPEHHEYELYLAVEDVDHSRTKTKSPANQWNRRALPPQNSAERVLPVAFRKRI